MARCPKCKHHFKTMEDEENMHECPHCGYYPEERKDSDRDTGRYQGGYRIYRNGTIREDFGSDR